MYEIPFCVIKLQQIIISARIIKLKPDFFSSSIYSEIM